MARGLLWSVAIGLLALGCLSAAAAASDDERLLEEFEEWCVKAGIEWQGIRVQQTIKDNIVQRGVFAQADAKAGQVILSIPFTAMMSHLSAMEGDLGPWLQSSSAARGITPTNEMALHLLHEQQREDSFWGPYIRMLPQEIPTTMFYDDAELEELQESSLLAFTKSRKDNAIVHFRQLLLPLMSSGAGSEEDDEFSDDDSEEVLMSSAVSVASWQWALSCLWSRAFSVKVNGAEMGALVPFADLFNAQAPGAMVVDPQVTASLTLTSLEYKAARDIKAGEEVLMPYGKLKMHSNAELLLDYGFVVDENPYDTVHLDARFLAKGEGKEELLARLGYPKGTQHLVLTHAFPVNLLWVCRILLLTEGQAADMEGGKAWILDQARNDIQIASSVYDAADQSVWPTFVPFNVPTDLRASDLAARRLARALRAYPTTADEDEELLLTAEGRRRAAIVVRLGEKRVLKQASQHILHWKSTLEAYPVPGDTEASAIL